MSNGNVTEGEIVSGVVVYEDKSVALVGESVPRSPAPLTDLYPSDYLLPLPEAREAYEPDYEELTKRTLPKYIKIHPSFGFPYVEIEYVLAKLNQIFKPYGWRWITTRFGPIPEAARVTKAGAQAVEFIAEGWLVTGWMAPVYGIGSAEYLTNNPKRSFAATKATAETEALKNAARKLGIGADVRSGGEADKYLAGQQTTIKTMFASLEKKGLGDKAKKVLMGVAPASFSGDKFDPTAIGESQTEDCIEGLRKLLLEAAQKSKDEAKVETKEGAE